MVPTEEDLEPSYRTPGSAVVDDLLLPDDRIYLLFNYPRGGCAPIALCVVTGETAATVEAALPGPMLAHLRQTKGGMLPGHIRYIPGVLEELGRASYMDKVGRSSSVALSLTRRHEHVSVLVWSRGHVHACTGGRIYDHWAVGSKKFQTRRTALKAYRNCTFMLVARDRRHLAEAAAWLARR